MIYMDLIARPPDAFEQAYAYLLEWHKLVPAEPLTPYERRILARGLRRLRERSSTGPGGVA